jgi:sulfatase maturation enzyme AslB (radical SAM superfamily)
MSNTSEPTVAERVYELAVELSAAKKEKKEIVKSYSENVKRIEDEIKDLLNDEQASVDATRKASDE